MSRPPLNKQTDRRIVGEMSNTRTLFWVAVAAGIHLVLIVGTSVGSIRDRWIDPAGAEAREKAEAEKSSPATSTTKPASQPVVKVKPAEQTASDDEKKLLEQKKNSPVVKGLTETAKPGEIPKESKRNSVDLDAALK